MTPPKVTLPITRVDEGESEDSLNIPNLLKMKRDGEEFSSKQISYLVKAICNGSMEDAQLGAFLMSVYLKGMTKLETAALTNAMKASGTVFQWPTSWKVVDKHSTGGVGDKISLVLAPALASKGLKVPMISGRGLGHTGGTLDKLESIPGFKVSLTEAEMAEVLDAVGCCIVGQTATVVPADKKMYAIRDVTSTVSSIPLIVSSIISKKACESLQSLVLDVKFGVGSFMHSQFEAESLAEALVDAGELLGIATTALITRMNNPIGRMIGNALEVEEAIHCLRGKGPEDLEELVVSLGGELLTSSGLSSTLEDGKAQIRKTLEDGSALQTFSKMIVAQGVSESLAEKLCGPTFNQDCLPSSSQSTPLISSESGVISSINALSIAEVNLDIGAGRKATSDPINYAAGIVLLKAVGDAIEKGESWAEVRHDLPLGEAILKKANLALAVESSQSKVIKKELIVRRISRQNKA